jgi:two-component system, OmpR family, response regulator RegX3
MNLAILEDDLDQRMYLSLMAKAAGHTVKGFSTPIALQEALKSISFDVILVDWYLGDQNAQEFLHWFRANHGWTIPLMVITACEEENTVCLALESGADDYIVKPIKPRELESRMRAVSRRTGKKVMQVIRVGDYEIDIERQSLALKGEAVNLTQKEFDMALCFFQSPGKLLSRDHLLNKVWGVSAEVDTRTVDTHASRLRRKLHLNAEFGWKLTPIYGFGYRFDRVEAECAA